MRKADGSAPSSPPTVADLVATLEAHRSSRVFIFAPDESDDGINRDTYEMVMASLASDTRTSPVDLLVHSLGGRPGAAYKIARALQARGGFTSVIPHHAKSAATMISLGAKKVVLSSSAELGPIDTQLPHPHEPEKTISALEGFKGLEAVSSFCQRFLDEAMFLVLRQTGRGVKDSLELATNFAAPVVRPLFEQIDPMDLGRYKRALEIGVEYAQRLLRAEGYTNHELQKIVDRLVYGYPEHGFVIDLAEAKSLGIRVEAADPTTETLATAIIEGLPGGSHVGFLDGGSVVSTMLPKAPAKKDGADGQRVAEPTGARA